MVRKITEAEETLTDFSEPVWVPGAAGTVGDERDVKFQVGDGAASLEPGENVRTNDLNAIVSVDDDVQVELERKYAVVVQREFSADTTLTADDMQGHLKHPEADTTPRTVTVPEEAEVAIEVGSICTIVVEDGAGAVTVTSEDELVWMPGGETGDRVITGPGAMTLMKVKVGRWYLSGPGVA